MRRGSSTHFRRPRACPPGAPRWARRTAQAVWRSRRRHCSRVPRRCTHASARLCSSSDSAARQMGWGCQRSPPPRRHCSSRQSPMRTWPRHARGSSAPSSWPRRGSSPCPRTHRARPLPSAQEARASTACGRRSMSCARQTPPTRPTARRSRTSCSCMPRTPTL